MPSWGELINKLNSRELTLQGIAEMKADYIQKLSEHTGRNVILYYSGFLQREKAKDTAISDTDINAFMENLYNLDKTKGLDLFLHTPGGDITATEQIINYLYSVFDGNIRAIIPQIAMSAGSMIAVSCNEIVMGKQSCLGPFDPQINGIACQSALREFQDAVDNVTSNPASLGLWQVIISRYNPTFLHSCKQAVELSQQIADKNIKCVVATKNVSKVLTLFNDSTDSKTHSRHINIKQCQEAGLKVTPLEDDKTLQELVLTIHHCNMILLDNSVIVKIVENNIGGCYLRQLSVPSPPPLPVPPKEDALNIH